MSTQPLDITFVLSLHGGLIRGGLEIQAEKTKAALESKGHRVEILNPGSPRLGQIVHFFGTFDSYWEVAKQCEERKVPYVCSPVFLPPTTGAGLKARAIRKGIQDRTIHRGQKRLYQRAKRLFTLSKAEDDNLLTYFGSGLAKAVRVPNGVDERFSGGDPHPFREKYGVTEDFVLCTGRIEPRKNQLTLIKAVKEHPLFLLGNNADPSYFDTCRNAAGPSVKFLDPIPNDDPLLASAYAAAKVFCLPSFSEVLSLSALEAGMAGCRIVLADTWGAEEHFQSYARYCNPKSEQDFGKAVTAAMQDDYNREDVKKHFSANYSWGRVADLLVEQYREVLSENA